MSKKIENMRTDNSAQLPFGNLEAVPLAKGAIILNKERFAQLLSEIDSSDNINVLKNRIIALKHIITFPKNDREGITNIDGNGDTISLRRDILISELDQILEAQTLKRANYYLKRLEDGVKKIKTNKINDINLLRWKEHEDIITDSLWVLDKRDSSGAHLGWYWGNFIPQIPHQMILRYTKKGTGRYG